MNRLSEFVFRHASVLGFKVESPAFATVFLIIRMTRFHIHYNEQTAMKKKMSTKYKNYKTAFQTMGLLMFGPLFNSCTSLHGVKLSIDN